uniref:RepA protein n=1 Tax=Saccharolobus islandicus TaxID=43080 RepID=Q9HH92_SACIS|nr:phage/plasmid primase, P4 family [Sulfolobus islandicus]CAC15841.1 RepA protein [Sulfolobus islandicus]
MEGVQNNLGNSDKKTFGPKEEEEGILSCNYLISDRLNYAKMFVEHGFAIFPIDPETKKPVSKEWQKYSHQPLTEEEKQKFLEMISQGYNYAVPGGQKNLVILDFEDKELLKNWITGTALDNLCKEKTFCVETPHGGIHIYLQADKVPEHKFNPLFIKDGKGIADLQSFNSYVVGPGSCINHKHCDSNKCNWRGKNYIGFYIPIKDRQIGEIKLKDFLRWLADKSKSLGIELANNARAWLEGKKEEKEDTAKEFEELRKELIKYDSGKSIERIKEEICNKKPPKLIKHIICEGKSYAEAGIDRSRGDWRVILYLMRHGVTDSGKILQLLPSDSKAKDNEKWDAKKYFAVTLSKAWNIVKKYLEAKKKAKEDKSTAKALIIEAIADEIMHEHILSTFIQTDNLKESKIGLFRFNKKKGIFEPFDERIEKIINKKLEEYKEFPLGSDKTRVVRNIKEEIMRRTQRQLLLEPLRIAFKNGTLEWTDKGIIWYDSKERTYKQYAFHYIDWNLRIEEIEKFNEREITVQDIEDLARRVCPKALETFKQWVDDQWILLYEIIGYTLYPKYIFNKAILLVGNGSNGKSTFLNLLLKILGKNNVTAVSLKRIMEGDRFAPIELYHKLANINSELFTFKVTNTDLFKKLTGEDYIIGEKKFRDPMYFINYAKLINATNELPEVKDQSYGFWRRWIVIEFPHQFPPDPNFFDKTFKESEIEGIITVSVLAFSRVLQQKKFDFEDSSADIKELWERKSDSVYAFVKDLIENNEVEYDPRNGDLFTPVKELYQAYAEWCNENDRKPEAQSTFTKRLESRFRIIKSQKRIGERVWCYVGIRLKNNNISTGSNEKPGDSNSLLELYKEFQGKVMNIKDLQSQLGLRAYELLDFCGKKGICHWIDEEHVGFD